MQKRVFLHVLVLLCSGVAQARQLHEIHLNDAS